MPSIALHLKQQGATASLLQAGTHQLTIDRPVEKGGTNQGPMGGQTLLMGIAGCFASTLYGIAIARDLEISDLEIKIEAQISETPPTRFESINLNVVAGSCSAPDQFEKLLKMAEKGCIAVNTIKNGMQFNYTLQ